MVLDVRECVGEVVYSVGDSVEGFDCEIIPKPHQLPDRIMVHGCVVDDGQVSPSVPKMGVFPG